MSTVPPAGWNDDSNNFDEDRLWAGKLGDLKYVLEKSYGLKDAKPIWARDGKSGEVLLIFEVAAASKTYYVWDAIDHSVFRFKRSNTLQKVSEEIKKSRGGSLAKAELTEVLPQ